MDLFKILVYVAVEFIVFTNLLYLFNLPVLFAMI